MKRIRILLQKMIPLKWFQYYKDTLRPKQRFRGKARKDVFTEIYNTNYWDSNESISGKGSASVQTQELIRQLEKVLKDFSIKSVSDIPCGDFNWIQYVNMSGNTYIGGDIVSELIRDNIKKYGERSNTSFAVIDLTTDQLPKTDLLICRDCLVHLSYQDISQAIQNIKKSGSKYLLTTSFPEHRLNYNIPTGEWRTLDLQRKPFSFPKPIVTINEGCTEANNKFSDKSLCLWEINQIPEIILP